MKINFERHKHNTDITPTGERVFSQHSFLVLSVVAPFRRVTIMASETAVDGYNPAVFQMGSISVVFPDFNR